MVAGICNSVGGGVFLTCHHGVGGSKYQTSVGVKTRVVNPYPETGGCCGFLESTNCSMHVTVEAVLSETLLTVSLSTAQLPGPSLLFWQVLVTLPPLKHGNELGLSFSISGSGMRNFDQPFTDTAFKVWYVVHTKKVIKKIKFLVSAIKLF